MSTEHTEQDTTTEQAGVTGPDPVVAQQDTEQAEAVEADQQTDQDQDTDGADKAGREAAKYRRQLRDAEAQRDTLAGQVEALQRRMVEQAAAAQIQRPEALWAAGVELADLIGEDGVPDPEKVRGACRDAAERLGLSRPPGGNYVPNEGRSMTQARTADFAAAFAPKH